MSGETRVVRTLAEWIRVRDALKAEGKQVGFVPTMGALHAGHVSLIERSVSENDVTVASIFVNPTQFNDPKDLEKYPRTFEADLAALSKAGADYLLYPEFSELYPDGYRYKVSESEQSLVLCGAHRPGHFDGVLTVVMKLLNLAGCANAYFGEKDYQQLQLVKGMVDAFFLPVRIVACATRREEDGLAMSSRNTRLAPEDRARAPEFSRILADSGLTCDMAGARLRDAGFEVDYVEERWGRRLGAVKIGGIRLIDNVPAASERPSENRR